MVLPTIIMFGISTNMTCLTRIQLELLIQRPVIAPAIHLCAGGQEKLNATNTYIYHGVVPAIS